MYTHRGAYLQRARRHRRGSPRHAHRLPVDAADVPLQRLGVHVGRHRRWAASTSAARSSMPAAVWEMLGASEVTPPVRRADGAHHAGGRSRRGPAPRAVSVVDRRRAALAGAAARRRGPRACGVTHLYGLTETYGPHRRLRLAAGLGRAPRLRADGSCDARQGVATVASEALRVVDRRGAGRPRRRRDDGRGRDARQQRDASATTATRARDRGGLPRTGGSTPAISGSCTPTATSSCATG